ncbi:dolichyl-phosphate-mannose-protein mannosyltransferase [Streptomyces sp. TLI_55]|uniref:phospholipid carrier-dependent glycosyltransferase n=1 Tax=Streptomyces sp. TLI_55 TaxID=1938861 RepID=UPI000BD34914|nr:phospholipid carrier-dependent glycosyltransferase [Streptomyces sp. TLI_55]SNX65778.1 dolichyl-phosphate-mannose-protein mannosyltransferase [Streptomyces sp. TLI_55]
MMARELHTVLDREPLPTAPARPPRRRPWLVPLLVCVLLAQMAFAMVTTAVQQTPTIDEPVYVATATDYLHEHRVRYNPEHPPLGKLVIAAGVAIADPHYDPSFAGDQGQVGRHLLYESGNDPWRVMLWARLPVIVLTLAFGLVAFAFARDLMGPAGGVVALSLYAFSPDLIAHGSLATLDVPAAGFLLTSVWLLWRARRRPRLYVPLAGVAAGAALATKMSTLAAVPVLLALAAWSVWRANADADARSAGDVRSGVKGAAGVSGGAVVDAEGVAAGAVGAPEVAGGMAADAGGVTGTTGGAAPDAGGAAEVAGGMAADAGGVMAGAGGATAAAGGAAPDAGGATGVAGGAAPVADGITPVAAGIAPVTQSITPVAGGITSAAGRITPVASHITPGLGSRGPALLRALAGAAVLALGALVVVWVSYLVVDPRLRWAPQQPVPDVHGLRAVLVDLLPFPEAYRDGMRVQFGFEDYPWQGFLFGRLYTGSLWYYLPAALLVKTPLGMLALWAAGAGAVVAIRRLRPAAPYLLVPTAVLLGAAMTGSRDFGTRYAIFVPMFLAVAAAGVLAVRWRWAAAVTGALVLFVAGSSLRTYPFYLPYSNEAFGGTDQTHLRLHDSNVDWGQDLGRLADRLRERYPGERIWLVYKGAGVPSYYGIKAADPRKAPAAEVRGLLVVSDSAAAKATGRLAELIDSARSIDHIGHSITVYRR